MTKLPMTDRDSAIVWARQILETDCVVLDTETTGLDNNAEVCQIGIINKNGDILLDQLIKPQQPIPPDATRIHGITNQMIKDAPTVLELESQLVTALKGKTVIIYNADYDARLLRQSFLAREATPENVPYKLPEDHVFHYRSFKPECAMEAFAAFYGDWNDYKGSYTWKRLTVAAKYFQLDTHGAHGAITDCLMTLGVVRGMAATPLSEEESQ